MEFIEGKYFFTENKLNYMKNEKIKLNQTIKKIYFMNS